MDMSSNENLEKIFGGTQPIKRSETRQSKGLSILMAAVFIVGAMCGSGILALPKAVVDCGWFGLPLLLVCGIISSYTGNILGKCWTIVRQRYPEYDERYIADPYPTIGYRAAGKWGERITRFCIIATLFGGATVFLLLIAGNISLLLEQLGHVSFHTCYLLLIVGVALTPLTFLGTPKDFWQAGLIAASTTTLAAILIVISIAAAPTYEQPVPHSNPSFVSFFSSFGTILFAFGGASCFPNIQVDMKKPDKFPVSVVIGILSVMTLYVPVSMSGFLAMGDNMQDSNILNELNQDELGWVRYVSTILITSHLFMAVLIVANPVNQDIEGYLGLPDKLSLKRCLIRSSVMLLMVFVGLTIPHFGILLSLVGGTTVTATNFIFPPLFYLLLVGQKTPYAGHGELPKQYMESVYTSVSKTIDSFKKSDSESEESKVDPKPNETSDLPIEKATWTVIQLPLYVKAILVEIIIIGVVGGVASTYSVLASLIDGSSGFTVPCYVNWATADP